MFFFKKLLCLRLNQAYSSCIAFVHYINFFRFGVAKHVEIMINVIQCKNGLLQRNGRAQVKTSKTPRSELFSIFEKIPLYCVHCNFSPFNFRHLGSFRVDKFLRFGSIFRHSFRGLDRIFAHALSLFATMVSVHFAFLVLY